MYLTEVVIIKPLIICGGCSFTHSPDSWAQVLGNHKNIFGDFTEQFFNTWRDFGINKADADPSIFPESVYEYWDDGEDLTDYIEVLVVAQGAAGQELNSRAIRNAIADARKENPRRPIAVFWQLSGWNRLEMLSFRHGNTWHAKLYRDDEHMTSTIRNWLNSTTEKEIEGRIDGSAKLSTPLLFTPEYRYWWKSGGGVPEQWEGTALETFMKDYYGNIWSEEYTAIKNLELIEYTRLYCDERDIPITIFPGWSHTWERALTLPTIEETISGFEILDRMPDDIVSDIDGFGGIGEWGSQYKIYHCTEWDDHYMDSNVSRELDMLQNMGGSNYEKYWDKSTGKWDGGNHPSCHIHALFCNQWIKPKVKNLLEKFN